MLAAIGAALAVLAWLAPRIGRWLADQRRRSRPGDTRSAREDTRARA